MNFYSSIITDDENKVYRAAIYNRCSTEDEAQMNALELQVKQSREICIKKGWIIIVQYIESVSGTSTKNRNEYLRMLDDMKSDKWDVLVIKSLDRLMRNNADWYNFLEILIRNNKKLYIYMDSKFYDASQHGFMSSIEMAMHEQFSRTLSNKIKNSHHFRQKHKSGYNISKKMYGWDKVEKDVYVLNEEEANFYRMALNLAKQGYGFHSIANAMYKAGARSNSGKKIEGSVWRNMCLSERCYGCVILHKSEMNFDIKERVNIPEEEWIYCEDALPPIISKQEWEEIAAVIKSRKTQDNRSKYHGNYPLSSKIYCGLCGGKYHRVLSPRRESGVKVPIWKCVSAYRNGRNVKQNELACLNENIQEDRILSLLDETGEKYFNSLFSKDKDIINRSLTLIKKMLDEKSNGKSIDKLKKELSKQKSKKDKLFEKLMSGVINDTDFKKYNDGLDLEINGLENEIKTIETDTASLLENEKRLKKIKDTLQSGEILKKAKGSALLDMVEKITVNGDSTVTFEFSKYKILNLMTLTNVSELDIDEDGSYFKVTVPYNGYRALKDRTNKEKRKLLEIIRKEPELSYGQYGEILEMRRIDVGARIKELFNRGCIKRDEDKKLIVIKDWIDE